MSYKEELTMFLLTDQKHKVGKTQARYANYSSHELKHIDLISQFTKDKTLTNTLSRNILVIDISLVIEFKTKPTQKNLE